ncbi:HNH endonuclease signature motif containing protein [Leucobacter tenebrionis]|uniref:HNH endonuclease signature motif containing protein n=1 Tax=Leucobacter tenebrionis TaxID=2873270 RepID=UPI002105FECF|nr:HNH endonuclease signature motif containing protein [Leucobacter tenebrionis]
MAGVRPLDQIRVSILTDELLHAAPSNETGDVDLSGVSARIQVTVPVLGLLPEEQRPEHRTGIAGLQGAAMLAGCGPIDTDTARFLASIQPTWDAVSCHPETGEVLAVDAYRPSEGLRRRVFARDQHCRYPGCLVVPHRADIDHAVDAALGGATATDNLQVLCRYHHTIKHNTGVEARMLPDGEIRWVSPLGTVITDRPRSRVAFRPVPPHDEDPSPPGAGQARRGRHPGASAGPKPRSHPGDNAREKAREKVREKALKPEECPF